MHLLYGKSYPTLAHHRHPGRDPDPFLGQPVLRFHHPGAGHRTRFASAAPNWCSAPFPGACWWPACCRRRPGILLDRLRRTHRHGPPARCCAAQASSRSAVRARRSLGYFLAWTVLGAAMSGVLLRSGLRHAQPPVRPAGAQGHFQRHPVRRFRRAAYLAADPALQPGCSAGAAPMCIMASLQLRPPACRCTWPARHPPVRRAPCRTPRAVGPDYTLQQALRHPAFWTAGLCVRRQQLRVLGAVGAPDPHPAALRPSGRRVVFMAAMIGPMQVLGPGRRNGVRRALARPKRSASSAFAMLPGALLRAAVLRHPSIRDGPVPASFTAEQRHPDDRARYRPAGLVRPPQLWRHFRRHVRAGAVVESGRAAGDCRHDPVAITRPRSCSACSCCLPSPRSCST